MQLLDTKFSIGHWLACRKSSQRSFNIFGTSHDWRLASWSNYSLLDEYFISQLADFVGERNSIKPAFQISRQIYSFSNQRSRCKWTWEHNRHTSTIDSFNRFHSAYQFCLNCPSAHRPSRNKSTFESETRAAFDTKNLKYWFSNFNHHFERFSLFIPRRSCFACTPACWKRLQSFMSSRNSSRRRRFAFVSHSLERIT